MRLSEDVARRVVDGHLQERFGVVPTYRLLTPEEDDAVIHGAYGFAIRDEDPTSLVRADLVVIWKGSAIEVYGDAATDTESLLWTDQNGMEVVVRYDPASVEEGFLVDGAGHRLSLDEERAVLEHKEAGINHRRDEAVRMDVAPTLETGDRLVLARLHRIEADLTPLPVEPGRSALAI